MIGAVVLVDLDDSLFQTRRKCSTPADVDDLTVMAVSHAGEPVSFASRPQAAFLNWIMATAIVIPVTGRSVDALRRVRLRHDLAVAAHGGVILRGDTPCDLWQARTGPLATRAVPELERIAQILAAGAAKLNYAIRVRIVSESGLPLYVVAKHDHPDGNDHELHRVADSIAATIAPDWTTHINGNNVAYLPPHLGKAAAVEALLPELRATHSGVPLIGLGDSLTDAGFMRLCDFSMMPNRSQLAGLLWRSIPESKP